MNKQQFILKGSIAFSIDRTHMESIENGYLVCDNGICAGAFKTLPEKYANFPITDCGDHLIIPGMSDLHVHAPQYTYRGLGMDCELLEWLTSYAFPEEAKYQELNYAREAYSYFVEDLKNSYTTRAVIFATLHNEATLELMNQLEQTGLVTYVGRVNMDRNGGERLQEESAHTSLKGTEEWLSKSMGHYQNTFPILTPRFIPSCSDELMQGLGKLAQEKKIRLQSHLSENRDEIAWVRELVPAADCYANAYERFDTLGTPEIPGVMAHCVYSDEREMQILKAHGTFVAHCPDCNMNVSSGIAPARKMLDYGLSMGLGTDVAGGSTINMTHSIQSALQASKLYSCLIDRSCAPLSFEEAFYLATAGGGQYFGMVGSFMEGYDFDAVIVDDSRMNSTRHLTPRERAERMIYNNTYCRISGKYVKGTAII